MKKIRTNGKFQILSPLTPAQGSGAAFSLVSVLSVLLAFVFVIAIASLGLVEDGYEKKDWYLYCAFLLSQITFATVFFVFLKSGKTTVKKITAFPKPRYFLVAIVLQMGLLCLAELNTWFLELLKGVGYQSDGVSVPSLDGFGYVGVLLVVAVLPAIFEEIFFRGLLLDGLKKFGEPVAALLCGALFSLYHKNPEQTVYQFCCGAAFALVALRSGSILPTVLSHFLNNAWIITMEKFGWSIDPVYTPFLIISVCCLLASAAYFAFFDKKLATRERATASMEATELERTEKKPWREFFLYASVGIALCALTWISNLLAGI